MQTASALQKLRNSADGHGNLCTNIVTNTVAHSTTVFYCEHSARTAMVGVRRESAQQARRKLPRVLGRRLSAQPGPGLVYSPDDCNGRQDYQEELVFQAELAAAQ